MLNDGLCTHDAYRPRGLFTNGLCTHDAYRSRGLLQAASVGLISNALRCPGQRVRNPVARWSTIGSRACCAAPSAKTHWPAVSKCREVERDSKRVQVERVIWSCRRCCCCCCNYCCCSGCCGGGFGGAAAAFVAQAATLVASVLLLLLMMLLLHRTLNQHHQS